MRSDADPARPKLPIRIFRLLLRAFPPEFRWRFGADMERDFQEDLSSQAGRGAGDNSPSETDLSLKHTKRLVVEHQMSPDPNDCADSVIRSRSQRSHIMKLWIELVADIFRTAPREHFEMLSQDVKYGLRLFRRDALPSVIAILALAIGIGANTAIFSCVNALILRPLPYPDSDKLVLPGYGYHELSPANFIDYRSRNQVFDGMAAVQFWNANLMGVDPPQRLQGFLVSPELFPILRVQPALGRWLLPEEEEPGKDGVVVISYGLWERQFGSDPNLLGQPVTINGRTRTVVGVMPKGFMIYRPADLWAPLSFDAKERAVRSSNYLDAVARLKPGVSIQKAQADMTRISERIQDAYPETNRHRTVTLVGLHDNMVGPARPALLLLMAAVAFVLLIACANVANLLLARAATRQKEVALRAALGARRTRLVRQLLTESMIVSLAGGAAGLLVAYSALRAISASLPPEVIEFIGMKGISIDAAVLAFTLALCLFTGLLFGMAPAIHAANEDLNDALKEEGRSGGGSPGRRKLRGLLVISEIAFSLVLLIASGMMVRSFAGLLKVDPGFNPSNVLTMELSLLPSHYKNAEMIVPFYRDALEGVRSVPGVIGAALTSNLPLGGSDQSDGYLVDGKPESEQSQGIELHSRVVSPGYFATMEITVDRGRDFDDRDIQASQGVVVLNEAASQRLWPGEDPIGKRITTWNPPGTPANPWLTVVGVVRNIHHQSLSASPEAEVYTPHAQAGYRAMTLVVRTDRDPDAFIAGVRAQISKLDKDQPVYGLQTLDKVMRDSLFLNRFITVLLAIFAGMALVMAAVGLYGVISYGVAGRTREIGVRIALGASRGRVLSLVVKEGMYLALIGEALGVGGAIALAKLMSSLPLGVGSADGVSFLTLPVALLGLVFLASYIPARRATRIDPVQALKYE